MGEKFEPDSSEAGSLGGFEFYDERTATRALEEREFDLRIKMFALDMAVQSLPSLVSNIESDDRKFTLIRRAAVEYEKILRGEPTS